MKVTIVGAGNVGASCAEYILINEIVDEIVLLDIKEGLENLHDCICQLAK